MHHENLNYTDNHKKLATTKKALNGIEDYIMQSLIKR